VKEIRTRQIQLLGRRLPIRTDVEDAVLQSIVDHAEKRLRQVLPAGSPQTEDVRHMMLALLVVTGELFEERTRAERLEGELAEERTRAEQLQTLLLAEEKQIDACLGQLDNVD